MATPPALLLEARLIEMRTQKQQRKQIIAQSRGLLKDPTKVDAFLNDLEIDMNLDGTKLPAEQEAANIKNKSRLRMRKGEFDNLKAEFENIINVTHPNPPSTPGQQQEAKKAVLMKFIYDQLLLALTDYLDIKKQTEANAENAARINPADPNAKNVPSKMPDQIVGILSKLPKAGQPGYPSTEAEYDALMKSLDGDADLKAFLDKREERAGAGDPADAKTTTEGNKLYLEMVQRGQSPLPRDKAFLDQLKQNAQAEGMIRGVKDPKTGTWSGRWKPGVDETAFIELRKDHIPTGQPHAKKVDLVVVRDIGFSTPEVLDLINGGDPTIVSSGPASGQPNPCDIRFNDGKADCKLIGVLESGKIVPYKIPVTEYDAWKKITPPTTAIETLAGFKKMSGEECRKKTLSGTTVDKDFAEMFVTLADLNGRNVHTNIKAPTTTPTLKSAGPAAGVVVPTTTTTTALTSSTTSKHTFP